MLLLLSIFYVKEEFRLIFCMSLCFFIFKIILLYFKKILLCDRFDRLESIKTSPLS